MNVTSILISIPVLVLLNIIFSKFTLKNYDKYYAKHIEFGKPHGKYIDPSITYIIWGIIGFIVLSFLMSQGIEEDFHLFFGLSGFTIGVLAGSLVEHIINLLIYSFVKNNPGEVTGKAYFSQKAAKAILACAYLKYAALLAVVYLFLPSSFILGGMLGLLTLSITSYTAKIPAE